VSKHGKNLWVYSAAEDQSGRYGGFRSNGGEPHYYIRYAVVHPVISSRTPLRKFK
jgi:hypothetical protein